MPQLLQEGPPKNNLVLSTKYQIHIRYPEAMMAQNLEIEFRKLCKNVPEYIVRLAGS